MCKILALLIFEKVRKCRIDGSKRLLSRPIRLATLKSNIIPAGCTAQRLSFVSAQSISLNAPKIPIRTLRSNPSKSETLKR